jgi:D-glycero-D-manno-heptose 1,7-bisphosphate phosphatase
MAPGGGGGGMRPAVFLDRDGTIITSVHYLADPALVRLIDGAAGAIRALRSAGYAIVVVSNQSAIGRGMLTVERLFEVHDAMCGQLAEAGASLDGFYFCPAVPASDDRTAVEHPDRKPSPGMLVRASIDLDLDLSRSWMIGDMVSDVLAGRNAGCMGSILVRSGLGLPEDLGELADVPIAADIMEAADMILAHDWPDPSGPSPATGPIPAHDRGGPPPPS